MPACSCLDRTRLDATGGWAFPSPGLKGSTWLTAYRLLIPTSHLSHMPAHCCKQWELCAELLTQVSRWLCKRRTISRRPDWRAWDFLGPGSCRQPHLALPNSTGVRGRGHPLMTPASMGGLPRGKGWGDALGEAWWKQAVVLDFRNYLLTQEEEKLRTVFHAPVALLITHGG